MPKNNRRAFQQTPDLGSLGGPADAERRKHSAKRLRLISGRWEQDLIDHMKAHFSDARQRATGRPDLSANTLQSVSSQISKLYDTTPEVTHEDETSQEVMRQLLKAGGLWPMSIRNQQQTFAIRENLMSVSRTDAGPQFRRVTADTVYAESSQDEPDLPVYLVEARPRMWDGQMSWTWEEYDVRDPAAPTFKILLPSSDDQRGPEDITAQVLDGKVFEGATYPYWYTEEGTGGIPYVPQSLYHAQRTGQLWDSFYGIEIVDGTLTLAALWSFWIHIVRDCSWPQRVMQDLILGGQGKGKAGPQSTHVEMDPMMVAVLRSTGTEKGSIGQWQPGGDPKVVGDSVRNFERRLLQFYEIGGDDFEASGSAESGYAIALKRGAVREAQRRMAPSFERGDLATIRMVAAQHNMAMPGKKIRETGYDISYPSLPKTPQEIAAETEEATKLLDAGLLNRVDAFMRIHGIQDRREALARLIDMQNEDRQLAAGAVQPPAME